MKYTPSTLFHGIRNDMLKQAFETAGIDLGIDWDKRKQETDKSVQKAWAAYDARANKKETACKKLDAAFHLIWYLGTAKYSVAALCRQYKKYGSLEHDLPPDFNDYSRFEIGLYLHMKEDSEILERIAEHIGVYDLSLKNRHWTEYRIAPVEIIASEEVMKGLASVLDEFSLQEKKGGNNQLETYPKLDDKLTYFIAKSDDKETSVEGKTNALEDFKDLYYIPPYEIIFCVDSKNGHISLHAPGMGKAKMHGLAAKLIKAMTGQETDIERLSNPTFDMTKFAVKQLILPSMTDIGYSRVYTERLWIQSESGRGMELAIKELDGNDAYATITENPYTVKLVSGKFSVSRAAIVMLPDENSRKKKIRFEVTEKSCTNRDLNFEQILAVEKLIDRMGVEI